MSFLGLFTGNVDEDEYRNAPTVQKLDKDLGNLDYYDKLQQGYDVLGRNFHTYKTQDDFRRNQLQLGNYYQNVLSGKTPSVAATQLASGNDAAMRQMSALAAAAPQVNSGLTTRNLLNAQGNMLAQQNQQAALLRAQEQATAAGQSGTLATQGNEQDLQAAAARAQVAAQNNENMRLALQGRTGLSSTQQQARLGIAQQNMALEERRRQEELDRLQGTAERNKNAIASGISAIGTGVGAAMTGGASLAG
jgi:hypothetical protein